MHEAHDRARARHRLYGLLGRLIATGRVDDVADTVRALPALAAVHEGGPDIAAAHHQWLAYELSAHESAFVLAPLAEIAPGLVLPGQQQTVSGLLAPLGQSEAITTEHRLI